MKIEILTDKGMPVSLVRYFMLDMKQFLIFLNNEEGVDAQGHVTIHISEIGTNGHLTANTVSDSDWENIKNTIKGIVGANKNNQSLPIQDMDYNALDGVSIIGDRALKLMSNYVDLLRANQPVFEKNVVENIIKPTQEGTNIFENSNIPNVDNFNANLNNTESYVATTEQNNVFTSANVEVPTTSIVDESKVEEPNTIKTFENNNIMDNDFKNVNSVDEQAGINYEQLYNEQVELINSLKNELAEYQNKFETLKNIINN